MNDIQQFAKDKFNIVLSPAQIELMRAWSDNKIILLPRHMGVSTANKVARAYLKAALPPEPPTNKERR